MKTIALLILVLAQSLALASPTRVTIDERNIFLLNGKPWFPMCFSPAGPPLGAKDPSGRDALDVLKAGGIDCFRVGTGAWVEGHEAECKTYMDSLAEHGMYAFLNLRELSILTPDQPGIKDHLGKVVEEFKDHPALALWKSMDEPAWGKAPIDGLMAGYRYIKEADPDHPIWMAHAPRNTVYLLHQYCKACDATGLDIYPISIPKGLHSNGHMSNREISVVGDYTEFITRAVDGRKPVIMVLQVCWSGVMPPHRLVFPTFRQERYMTYQAIIKGARGLFFFGMNLCLDGRDEKLGFNWTYWNKVMCPLLKEIGKGSELHQALLVPDSKIPLTVSGAPDIEFTAREVGDFLYVLAAKREGPEAKVQFSSDVLNGEVEVMFEGRKLAAKNGTFTDPFAPNDVHVYKVRLR